MTLTRAKAHELVATLDESEIVEYVESSEQFLFADEVCSRFDFPTTERNVDHFEIALDQRGIDMGIF